MFKRTPEQEEELKGNTGARFDNGKARYDLIPQQALHEIVLVYTFGAKKYDPTNWVKGMPWSKVIGPMLRHASRWLRGEKYDKESGIHHLAHLIWNAIALFIYQIHKLGTDDRHPIYKDLEGKENLNDIKKLRKEFYNEDILTNSLDYAKYLEEEEGEK